MSNKASVEARGCMIFVPDEGAQELLDFIREAASFELEHVHDFADALREAGYEESEICPDYIIDGILGGDEDE